MAVTVKNRTGEVKITVGTFTHTVGSASETISVGGIVWAAFFHNADASGAYNLGCKWSPSVSGNVTTITFYAQEDITDGRFIIFHSGS